jgi:hypothetical protein
MAFKSVPIFHFPPVCRLLKACCSFADGASLLRCYPVPVDEAVDGPSSSERIGAGEVNVLRHLLVAAGCAGGGEEEECVTGLSLVVGVLPRPLPGANEETVAGPQERTVPQKCVQRRNRGVCRDARRTGAFGVTPADLQGDMPCAFEFSGCRSVAVVMPEPQTLSDQQCEHDGEGQARKLCEQFRLYCLSPCMIS